jgi:catechol 2,3-dioxygenase-like lactoylglutathione lyase family enzyme
MICQLDHVNVSVVSNNGAIEFLRIAFPQLRVRGGGPTAGEGFTGAWVHLGTDELYVSLNEATTIAVDDRQGMQSTGINHVGFMVDDVDDLMAKYGAAGFKCSPTDESPSRKRLYVTDADHIMWEFIEYLSDDPAVRNDYSI